MNGDLDEGVAGQAVTLTLTSEIDISRGDILSTPDAPPRLSRHLEAHLVWMLDEPLQPGQVYLVKTASAVTPGRVSRVHYAVDVNTLEQNQAPTLGLNGIGVVRLELDRAVAFDPYRQNRDTGSFILIDRFSNATVAAGMVISAAPVEVQTARPERGTGVTEEAGFLPRRFSLTELDISGSEMGVADLTREWGPIEFDVSAGFLDYLGKGNRVLVRLRDVGQLEPVARMAYEHNLNFEFGRYRDGVNVILYKNSPEPAPTELEGGGL
jgi:sulfate adenylyltransferase subunit 1